MAGFAKFDGIDGEATDAQHEAWVNFLTLDWGVALPGGSTGQSRRRGSVVVDDLVLEIEYGKAAPQLLERCLRGQVIPKVDIELTAMFGAARRTYLAYEMKKVIVTSYRVHASGEDESSSPTVNVSVSFGEIKVTYTEMGATGVGVDTVETEYAREEGSARKQVAAPATTAKKATSKKATSKKRKKVAARRKSS